MTVSNDSGISQQPSRWSDLRRRYIQKRYLLSWILAALIPFILLRLLFMTEIALPFFQSAGSSPISSPISLEPQENVSQGQPPINFTSSPASATEVKPKSSPESPLIPPDEDAWITHDDWINHYPNTRVDKRKEVHGSIPNENSTDFEKSISPTTHNGENFGLPEDNDKEELALEAMEKQLEANAGNAQQEKYKDEEMNKDKNEHQAADNKNAEGQGRIDKQSEGEDRNTSEENTAAQGRKAEVKRNVEWKQRETNAAQEEAEVTTNFTENERSKVEEHNDVSPASNVEVEHKGGADEQGNAEQKEARDQKQPKEKTQGEEQQELEEKKPLEEKRQPKYHLDKEEDKSHQDSDRIYEETPPGECDLFEGEWEHDPEGPLYTNSTCFYIQQFQNCMSNGRPDTDYMFWKWKPRGCDLPRFDAKSFLDSFRGKTIGFVGDSIARNQMQSLLCLLSQVEIPFMTYESADDKTVRWLYKEHQITLAVVWSPYLLKHVDGGVLGFQKGQNVLYIDVLDTAWTSVMQDFDIVVFLTGQWYYKGSVYIKQEKVVGCHYCPGLNLTEVGYYASYRGGIRQVLEKVSHEFKGVAIMSTFPLSHFENGTWDTGGYCKREQPLQPLQSAQFPGDHNEFREIVIEEFNDVVKENSERNNSAQLEILDVTKVSLQRADGHPGPFRYPPSEKEKFANVYYPNDCLHWCLPGPIEAWNQLVVQLVGKYY